MVANGATHYSKPIKEALRIVDERSRFYRRSGSEPYKPWVILVTDGEPLDDITGICSEINKLQQDEKIRFIALGVGNFNTTELKRMTDVVFRIDDTDFSSFFNWVAKSMRSVSLSSPGEKPQLPHLEGNVYRDRDVSDI